jgi:hypothetical protein
VGPRAVLNGRGDQDEHCFLAIASETAVPEVLEPEDPFLISKHFAKPHMLRNNISFKLHLLIKCVKTKAITKLVTIVNGVIL